MDMQNKTDVAVNQEKREVVFTHHFDAPRDLVYKAYTDPQLVPQWWGPERLTTVVDRMEVRPGGAWRFIQYDPEGNEYAFNGIYREVVPSERLVYTFEYEGFPGHIMIESVTLEDLGGKTRVIAKDSFETTEDFKGLYETGMEEGAKESFQRFTALVERLKKEQREKAK